MNDEKLKTEIKEKRKKLSCSNTSINPHYTLQYSQPAEYRLSHDSVFLARQVFEKLQPEEISKLEVLDICAGCGVIGMDLLFHAMTNYGCSPLSIDFVEVQECYLPHFQENENRLRTELQPFSTKLRFVNKNYSELLTDEFRDRYSLIIGNPPYFFPEWGRLSPSAFKNRCRFFIDSDFATLIESVVHGLAPNGRAFLLLRDLPEHGWNVLHETEVHLHALQHSTYQNYSLHCHPLGEIRGTPWVQICKQKL